MTDKKIKETFVGIEEAFEKKGVRIKAKETLKKEDIPGKIYGINREIEGLRNETGTVYRAERKLYCSRLSLGHKITELQKKKRDIMGLKEIKTLEQIKKEVDKEYGFKK